jgi:hypothetical protein
MCIRSLCLNALNLATASLLIVKPGIPATQKLSITSVVVAEASGQQQMTIGGVDLVVGATRILLDGKAAVILSYTATQVIAVAPPGVAAAGDYRLVLVNSLGSATFEVSLGAVGPLGPQGRTGPAGPQGLPGPSGPKGAQGLIPEQLGFTLSPVPRDTCRQGVERDTTVAGHRRFERTGNHTARVRHDYPRLSSGRRASSWGAHRFGGFDRGCDGSDQPATSLHLMRSNAWRAAIPEPAFCEEQKPACS